MVAMEMMVVVAMPVHHHNHTMATMLPRGRSTVSSKSVVTARWKETPDRQQIQSPGSQPERGRSGRSNGSSNGSVQYTGAVTAGGTWYSAKPSTISVTTVSDKGASATQSSTNSVLNNTLLNSAKSDCALPVNAALIEPHRLERLSSRPTTPVLLPSQVRWPQRESGEYVCGKSDGSLGYKTARIHARSRSYDLAYRTPLGSSKPITVQDLLMSRYDAEHGLAHLQEDEEDELGPLELDEHGVWHSPAPRSPSPSQPSQRRSPSTGKVAYKCDPSPNRAVRRRSPSPSRTSRICSPSTGKVAYRRVPSPSRSVRKRSPSPSRTSQRRSPSTGKVAYKRGSSPNRAAHRCSPSPSRTSQRPIPSTGRGVHRHGPSPTRVVHRCSPSPSQPIQRRNASPVRATNGHASPRLRRTGHRRSPSPPRRRHRNMTRDATPVIPEHSPFQSPRQDPRVASSENLDGVDTYKDPPQQRQHTRQSSGEANSGHAEKLEGHPRHRPCSRHTSFEELNHFEPAPRYRQRSRPSSEDNESVNSEITKPRPSSGQSGSEDVALIEILEPPPRRRPRCRKSCESHYGTDSEPQRHQQRQRRSRQIHPEAISQSQSSQTPHEAQNRSPSSRTPTPVGQSQLRQGSRESSSESLLQSQSSDSRSERSNSKTSTEDLVPCVISDTDSFTQRKRSRSRPPNAEDTNSQRSEPFSRHSVERQRSQSVQPRLGDYTRSVRSEAQRHDQHPQIVASNKPALNNKHQSVLQCFTTNQDRNFDGSRHTHAARQSSLSATTLQGFSSGQNSKFSPFLQRGGKGEHLWDLNKSFQKSQNLKTDRSERPKRPAYTPMQTRILQFETTIHKIEKENLRHQTANQTANQKPGENHVSSAHEGHGHKKSEGGGYNSQDPRTPRTHHSSRLRNVLTSKARIHPEEEEVHHEGHCEHSPVSPPRSRPPGSPHMSTLSPFIRGIRFKSKPTQSRNPPILCDGGPRRSLGSQRRGGNRKRVQIVVEETEPGHDAGYPDDGGGEHGYRSSPKVLLGHIASLSHSFSFGTRRKHQARNAEKQSLVVPDGLDFQATKKLNGAPSATSILHPAPGGDGGEENGALPQHGQRSARWAIGFDRLLDDCAGRATFTEFLKKEVSQENIEFWLKCENYKQLGEEEERRAEAQKVWKDHLAPHACDSVNVDSVTLTGVEEGLQMAPPTLFDDAQTHIFQLMKQDSYPRFLKSELYKKCVVAEMEGKPLPFSGVEQEDMRPREEKKPVTKSKSMVSMDKGKRRQSFFPFPWNKSRSEKRLVKGGPEGGDAPRLAHKNEDGTVRVGAGSLDLVDLSVMSREVRPKGSPLNGEDEGTKDENKEFCRVILPDGSTTVFHAKAGTPIRETLQHLCQRRTLTLPALEVFQHGTDKPLDLTKDVSLLASKSIWVEQRILFQADLPSRRPLVVRAKPGLSLRDTLKPILPKYNLKVDNMVVHMVGCDGAVDLETTVSAMEGRRLLIQTEEDFAEWGGFSHRGKAGVPSRSKSTASLDNACDDDHLVNDVMDGKLDVAHLFDEHGVFDPDKKHDKYRHDDGRVSGLFGFIRRNSAGEKDASWFKTKNGHAATLSGPEVDRPRTRHRPPIKDREAENLFEQLNKLSGRLDDQRGDQRGLLQADLELPDFLKVDRTPGGAGDAGDSPRPEPRMRERRNSDSSLLDAEVTRRLSQSPAARIPYMDQSFSHSGVVPTHAQADEAFGTARQFPGSPELGRPWAPGGVTPSGVTPSGVTHGGLTPPSAARRRYSPRAHTPEARRPLLPDMGRRGADDDLCARPLEEMGCDPGMVTMDIASYSPPVGATGQMPPPDWKPEPPPRKPLTTPRKFLPTPSRTPQPRGTSPGHSPWHSQQNSTSSELSHHSDGTSGGTSGGSGGGISRGGGADSPPHTPSPTTHHLLVAGESSPESAADPASPVRCRPLPPPRPSRRLHAGSSGGSSADEGGRLVPPAAPTNAAPAHTNSDMQVSYV